MRIGLTYTGWEEKHVNYVRWLLGEGTANGERGSGRNEGKVEEAIMGDGRKGEGVTRDNRGRESEEIEVIRLSVADDNLAAFRSCDGLVLSGGVDVHPVCYGGELDYVQAPRDGWEKERDDFEAALLKEALAFGKPVLGICRGLQLINVCCKGSLIQDLGPVGDATHQNRGEKDELHAVRIEKGSLLYDITGGGGMANSAHHQAIDRLGEGLRVNCYAADGTIEGIEWDEPAGKPFLLAVQWHPERMFTGGLAATALYKNVRERFIAAIKQSKVL